MSEACRVVYDCNVFVQALINPTGPAGRCVNKVRDSEVVLFVSPFVLTEIREIHLKLPAKYGVTAIQTARLADAMESFGKSLTQIVKVFEYSRDPDDAHYINLALAADAKLIVSRDRDLLDLMSESSDGKIFRRRFPTLQILDPVQFLTMV